MHDHVTSCFKAAGQNARRAERLAGHPHALPACARREPQAAHPNALSRLPSCAVRDLSAYLSANSFFIVSRYA